MAHKRPNITDDIVAKNAALELLDEFKIQIGVYDAKNDDQIIEDIANAIRLTNDGFAIAKELDHYAIDSSLVEWLDDNVYTAKRIALGNIVKQWIANNDIRPKHNVGDSAVYKGNDAEILKVTDAGQYLLYVPALGHVKIGTGTHGIYVDWEDVESW